MIIRFHLTLSLSSRSFVKTTDVEKGEGRSCRAGLSSPVGSSDSYRAPKGEEKANINISDSFFCVCLYSKMSFPGHISKTDTVFLGNSLTEGFDLTGHFGRDDLINRGMSGNLTQHVYYRLEEITKTKPAAVFLMIGINDVFNGVKKEIIVSNIQKIIDDIIRKCPDTNLYLQSVLPVNETNLIGNENLNIRIYELNNSLRILCKQRKIPFIDIHPDFLNDKGEMDMIYTYDGVHLSKDGYLQWARLLKKYL